jgi:arylsulfatase A
VDIWPLLAGEPDAKTPHQAYYYYWGNELHAVRSGRWKLHFPHEYRSLSGAAGKDGHPGGYSTQRCGLELYDLESDVGEQTNVAADHPEIVQRLQSLADEVRKDLGDSLTGQRGAGVREPGRI